MEDAKKLKCYFLVVLLSFLGKQLFCLFQAYLLIMQFHAPKSLHQKRQKDIIALLSFSTRLRIQAASAIQLLHALEHPCYLSLHLLQLSGFFHAAIFFVWRGEGHDSTWENKLHTVLNIPTHHGDYTLVSYHLQVYFLFLKPYICRRKKK